MKFNIDAIHDSLFSPNGRGYYWVENFISEAQTHRLIDFYNNNINIFDKLIDKNFIYSNCPPYVNHLNGKNILIIFPWNKELDESILFVFNRVNELKNELEDHLYINSSFCMSMRFVDSFDLEVDVPLHRDYIENDDDSNRIQASLFLSDPGYNFDANGGFYFKDSSVEIYPHNEINKVSGSLLIFRYRKPHGVKNIIKLAKKNGFLRVIFPEVKIAARPSYSRILVGKVKLACRQLRHSLKLMSLK